MSRQYSTIRDTMISIQQGDQYTPWKLDDFIPKIKEKINKELYAYCKGVSEQKLENMKTATPKASKAGFNIK